MSVRLSLLLFLVGVFAGGLASTASADSAGEELLPPQPAWSGESESLAVAADHPWATTAERTGFRKTATYGQTERYLRRLAEAREEITLLSLGESHEGRHVRLVVASREGADAPAALRANGRPTLLVQAGIHAGEIDGKPAGLMLLRDLTVTGELSGLLSRVNLLFVPILNPDGHERSSPYARINQRGPVNAGWRTNARNLNLNRDYAKLDTPELRAQYERALAGDPELRRDPGERLLWFYQRSPWYDEKAFLYPVARETASR